MWRDVLVMVAAVYRRNGTVMVCFVNRLFGIWDRDWIVWSRVIAQNAAALVWPRIASLEGGENHQNRVERIAASVLVWASVQAQERLN